MMQAKAGITPASLNILFLLYNVINTGFSIKYRF